MDDFDGFVRAHWTRLHATVSRTARRYHLEPDDALQEALLRAYAQRATFESEQHAVNWVCRVAHDLLCDQRRSWYGRRVSASGDLPEAACGLAPDPADVVVRRDAGREVLRAVGALPPADRLLLWQHAVDGRSYADIAREAARPLATVRSLALRARLAARRHLAAGEGSIGAAFLVRVRRWCLRGQAHGNPHDAVAAVLAIGLVLGGSGAGAPSAALPPAGSAPAGAADVPADPAGPAAAGSGPGAASGGGGSGGAGRAGRPPAPRGGSVPVPVPFGMAAFSGDRTVACRFDEPPAIPFSAPVAVLRAEYSCAVSAESTACTAVAAAPFAPAPVCSFTLAGTGTGKASGISGGVMKCRNGARQAGRVIFRVGGADPYVIPVSMRFEYQGIVVTGEKELGGQVLSVSADIPFVCAEGLGRAPGLSGRVVVA